MADDDPDRPRLEDMLKASEQRRTPKADGQAETRGDEPAKTRGEPDGSSGEGDGTDDGGRSSRATGSAATTVTAGLIVGGLSIPGALLPILGLLLGIAAIVLGVIVARRSTDVRAKLAIGLGTLGAIISIVAGVIGVTQQDGNGGTDSEESDDGGGDSDENAEAVASCLDDAELSDVDEREVSEAEDIDVLDDALADADAFVSAADSGGRDVYVLVYDSEADADRAVSDIPADDQEAGVRGDSVVVFSRRIGPEDRVAIEECFLNDD